MNHFAVISVKTLLLIDTISVSTLIIQRKFTNISAEIATNILLFVLKSVIIMPLYRISLTLITSKHK